MKKQFSNLSDLSNIENILLSKNIDLSKRSILKIVKNYISEDCNKTLYNNRTMYELVKILNLPKQKTEKILNTNTIFDILNKSDLLVENSTFISCDLLILRIIDNIHLRSTKFEIENEYLKIKRNLINKLSTFNYKKEAKEKEVTILCWIDTLLANLLDFRISPTEYITITQKILDLTTPSKSKKIIGFSINEPLLFEEGFLLYYTYTSYKNLASHLNLDCKFYTLLP